MTRRRIMAPPLRWHEGFPDYRAALAIVDGFGAPASQDRLLILDNMAALQCRTGGQDAGRQTLELGRTALDRDNPGHATWPGTYEKRLAQAGFRQPARQAVSHSFQGWRSIRFPQELEDVLRRGQQLPLVIHRGVEESQELAEMYLQLASFAG